MTHMYKLIAGRTVKKIENIATNSKTTGERIEKYYSRQATIIPPGVEYSSFENAGDERFFFYPSRLIINKQQDYVIRAFRIFVSKSKNKKYSLVLAGTISKDPEHMKYLEYLKKLSKNLNVKILTNLSDDKLKELYSKATAVLFASKNEDYGLVPLEGMSSGKLIISINEGGPRETILDGKTGFLVNSEKEMAEKMQFIVENPSIAEQMGNNARKHVIKNYSWHSFFKKMDLVLEKTSKKD